MSQGLLEPGVVPAAPLLTPSSAHCPVHQPGKRQRSSTSKLLFLTPHPPWDAKGVSLADETTLFRKNAPHAILEGSQWQKFLNAKLEESHVLVIDFSLLTVINTEGVATQSRKSWQSCRLPECFVCLP